MATNFKWIDTPIGLNEKIVDFLVNVIKFPNMMAV
jgi:hypothetical protein